MTGSHRSRWLKNIFSSENLSNRGNVGITKLLGDEREQGLLIVLVEKQYAILHKVVTLGGRLIVRAYIGDPFRIRETLERVVSAIRRKAVKSVFEIVVVSAILWKVVRSVFEIVVYWV